VALAEVVTAAAIEESWATHWPAAVEEVVESQALALVSVTFKIMRTHARTHARTNTHTHTR
jgi:hypothetical protein